MEVQTKFKVGNWVVVILDQHEMVSERGQITRIEKAGDVVGYVVRLDLGAEIFVSERALRPMGQ